MASIIFNIFVFISFLLVASLTIYFFINLDITQEPENNLCSGQNSSLNPSGKEPSCLNQQVGIIAGEPYQPIKP